MCYHAERGNNAKYKKQGGWVKHIVPTLRVGMHTKTLRVDYARKCADITLLNTLVYFIATVNRDAERRWICYHAERGNNGKM